MDKYRQIIELNTFVRTHIAPSPIQGVGLFALREIKRGESLYSHMAPKLYNLPYEHFDELHPTIKEYLLSRWPQIVNGSAFAYPDTRLQAYLNHSDDPNYDGVNDLALRDIAEGEEVTEDYRKIEGWEKVFPFLVV